MPDKGNDTGSRVKHATAQGFAHSVPEKSKFGTPEEIGARVGGSFTSLPDSKPSNFRQLGPASTGENFNNKRPSSRKGNAKYGNPRSYM